MILKVTSVLPLTLPPLSHQGIKPTPQDTREDTHIHIHKRFVAAWQQTGRLMCDVRAQTRASVHQLCLKTPEKAQIEKCNSKMKYNIIKVSSAKND